MKSNASIELLATPESQAPSPYSDLQLSIYPGVMIRARFWLRPLFPQDWVEVQGAFQDPVNIKYFGNGLPLSSEVIQARIQVGASRNLRLAMASSWLIITRDGTAGCFWATPSPEQLPKTMELAYCIHARFAGQGLTSSAGQCIMGTVLTPPNFEGTVFATVHPDNKASQGVLLKLGLKPDPERQGVPKFNSIRNYYIKTIQEKEEDPGPITWAFALIQKLRTPAFLAQEEEAQTVWKKILK